MSTPTLHPAENIRPRSPLSALSDFGFEQRMRKSNAITEQAAAALGVRELGYIVRYRFDTVAYMHPNATSAEEDAIYRAPGWCDFLEESERFAADMAAEEDYS